MQLERLAELLKGSAPNMFCNNLCLPQSLSGTLYHCTQKNKPSTYIFLPKIVSHLSIGLLKKVEEGDADGSKEEHDHTQPMFCNRLANFSTFSALSNISISGTTFGAFRQGLDDGAIAGLRLHLPGQPQPPPQAGHQAKLPHLSLSSTHLQEVPDTRQASCRRRLRFSGLEAKVGAKY